MLFSSVNTLLIRISPPPKSTISELALLHLPCFPSLPHSQNPYIHILIIPNHLRTLAKNMGGTTPKANLRRNSSIAAHQIRIKSRPALGLFTKPSPAPRHHTDILSPAPPRRPRYGERIMSTLSSDEIRKMHAYWRAANYLTVGQIYLKDNPLLERPLTLDDVKPRLLGHWGTTSGLNFIYTHLNRVINERDLNMMYIIGPGHGGPGIVAHTYLEGSYTEIYPHIERNRDGIKRLFRQFSWPYGIPSHVAPETPGSIHEGGELGYSLLHAYGAAYDNPNLIVACVVGDGEAETGPLATSWHSNKLLNPATDGAVLPILHLNGYKIANPTVLARIPHAELEWLLRGYGYRPITVAGDDPDNVHQLLAAALDEAFDEITAIQQDARSGGNTERPVWPMIVLRTPKGWTGPQKVDGKQVEGTWRAHQVPLAETRDNPAHRAQLDKWLRSYHPEELIDDDGRLRAGRR